MSEKSEEELAGTPTEPPPIRTKKKARVAHIIFLVIVFSATLGLAWWQWTRFQSGSGTFQNLGYALQWPFLGGFLVYGYRKFLQLENESIRLDEEERELAQAQSTPQTSSTDNPEAPTNPRKPSTTQQQVTEIDESFLPQRPTLEVEEFNQLNDPHRRRKEHHQEPEPNRE